MKVLITFLTLLLLSGCGVNSDGDIETKVYGWYCSYESQDKRAKFTSECIKNANPMSDEEPEDMIAGCVRAAKEVYCFWADQFQARTHYKKRKENLQEE